MPAVSSSTNQASQRVAATLKVLLALALPMVLARATQSVMTFADTLMVKDLGPEALAATATGGLNTFMVAVLPMGTVFIVQSFVSQQRGRGRIDDVVRYAWYGLLIAAITAILGVVVLPAIDPLLSISSFAPGVRTLMSSYMRIRLLSMGPVIGMEALGAWYGGLGNTWMQMIAGVIAMVSNVFLNWVLIHGHLGAPAMGVAGTALASTIGCWLGFGFLAVAFWRRWGSGLKRSNAPLDLSLREFGRLLRFGLPNGVNWLLEFGSFQMFVNGVISGLGTIATASFNVVLAINSLVFMPAFGLASSGAILAGNAIGSGDKDHVWPTVRLTLGCAWAWVLFIGSFYLLAPHLLLTWFAPPGESSIELIAVGSTMLMMSAGWLLFDSTVNVLGETLRAAGDTTWTAVARIILAWGVFIPIAFLVVRRWHGGTVGAMSCFIGYLILLAGLFAYRFRSGKWRRIEMIEPKLV